MPSKTPKQARFMAAIAHDPQFARRVGVPQKVGAEFNQADAGTGILRGMRRSVTGFGARSRTGKTRGATSAHNRR